MSKKVKADVSQWSAASKRSVIAEYKKYYEDEVYDCLSCGKKQCVYSALDQKHDFEVRKRHIWATRTLCSDCWMVLAETRSRLLEFERRWVSERGTLERNADFLNEWRDLLERDAKLRRRPDTARLNMVGKLLERLA